MSTNSPVSPTGRGKKKLAPPKASICTPELLKKILEIDDLSSIEDIEILFSTITDLNGGGLALCKACRSLTLIDTALLDISPQTLAPISSTLERLNLSQQGLTKISGVLNLPVLRELYLQENSITRIEGLNGCPRLQRVWLYGNKISRIDGLQCVGELRELWVQQNKISRVGGLEGLVHLETLGLAGNKISDYKDLQRLSLLPALKSVSFEDIHFGSCPVTRLDGYRNFALCYLKQVTHLDGLEVTTSDRAAAEDAYMESILKFNGKIEEITREGGREAMSIEARRARTKSHGDSLRGEMVSAFNMLEKLVKEGLGNLHAEHNRQIRVRKQNQISLEGSLRAIAEDYALEVDRQLAIERDREKNEDKAFALLEARTLAEKEQAILVSTLQYTSSSPLTAERIACQYVGDHLPDFQFILTNFQNSQKLKLPPPLPNCEVSKLSVLKCYRVYNEKIASEFVNKRAEDGDSGGKMLTVYACCGIEMAKKVFQGRLEEDIILFSDPLLAVSLGSFVAESTADRGVLAKVDESSKEGEQGGGEEGGDVEDVRADVEKVSKSLTQIVGGVDVPSDDVEDLSFGAYFVIQCRISVGLFSTITLEAPPEAKDLGGLVGQVPKSAQALKVAYPNDAEARGEEDVGDGVAGGGKGYMYAVKRGKLGRVLPEYSLLCVGGELKEDIRQVEALLEGLNSMSSFDLDPGSPAKKESDGAGDSLLRSLETRIESECRRYQEALWEEVEPSTADKLRQADEDVKARADMITKTRGGIEEERENQENMLRDFRNTLVGVGGAGGSKREHAYHHHR